MTTYNEIIELAKAQIIANYAGKKATVTLGEVSEKLWSELYRRIEIYFDNCIIDYGDNDIENNSTVAVFEVGFKTPSGYLSKKKIPIDTSNFDQLTNDQLEALFVYQNEFKVNTYDPFYAEHEAARKSAAGWNYVCQHFITDPYCTR